MSLPEDMDMGGIMHSYEGMETGAAEGVFAAVLERARGEFLEMPGLQLTEAQAARLWSVDSALCGAVLSELVAESFLVKRKRELFARP